MSIFRIEDASSRVTEFLVANDVDWIPPDLSRQAFLYGKLGRWFPRDTAILSQLGTTIASAKLDFWVTVLYDNGTWHW
jgi:hypothetical protein